MKSFIIKNSYCLLAVAIFLVITTNSLTAQQFVRADTTFKFGMLYGSYGPLISPTFDKSWEMQNGLHLYASLPLSKYSSVRVGLFDAKINTLTDESNGINFSSLTLYGSVIPFQIEWVPNVILSPEIGLGFTKIEPEEDIPGVAAGSETEILAVAGLQLYSTAFGKFQPVINAQYFRVFTYFEYDYAHLSIGFRYSFNPPQKIKRWWRAGQ